MVTRALNSSFTRCFYLLLPVADWCLQQFLNTFRIILDICSLKNETEKGEKKMRILSLSDKAISAAVLFILLLAVSSAVSVLPALGQTILPGYTAMPDRKTGTEVGISPRLVGLGQELLINILTYPAPSGPTYYAQDLAFGLVGGFANISCTITMPDGTKDTFMPIDETLHQVNIAIPGQSQIVGSLQFRYKPTQVGNYSVTGSFPGQFYTTNGQYTSLKLSVYYKPSSSSKATTFTVQEDQVLSGQLNGWPWSPLPTGYWENPVYTNNREWAAISGPWVQPTFNMLATEYNTYSTAPRSPHILWANQVGSAGLAGGVFGSLGYTQTSAGAGNIILDGKIYQNEAGTGKFDCVDLRTGQLLWSAPGSINGAQRFKAAFQLETQQNEGGVSEYLWGGIGQSLFGFPSSPTWTQYSVDNGAVIFTIKNVPTDLMIVKYDDGDPIFWCIQSNYSLWNTTRPLGQTYLNLIKWDLNKLTKTSVNLGAAFLSYVADNWADGVVWNVSINNLPGQRVQLGDNNWISVNPFPFYDAGVVVVKPHNDMETLAGFNIDTGAFLWVNNATALNPDVKDWGMGASPSGPLITQDLVNGDFVAYNVKTGQEQWRASGGNLPWSMLPAFTYVYNNGVNFFGSYDGYVYAYNSQTGERVWQSDFVGAEDESIYNNQPFNGASCGADGILYFSTSTCYQLQPRTRFHALYAIDEKTGHFLWKLPINIGVAYGGMAIAYGYLVATDNENGIQYVIGKGKTSTTVSIQSDVITAGSSALIKGSVMDMSPGQPNTAAISDADMSVWMDYLHGQNATLINSPPTPHGVSVQLTAMGSDGTVIDLGKVTTDSSGQFLLMWKAPKENTYTVYATFAGSDSYWSSYAETGLGVSAAAESPTTPQPSGGVTSSEVMTYVVVAAVAIIIAIAVATVLMLRKGKQ